MSKQTVKRYQNFSDKQLQNMSLDEIKKNCITRKRRS